MRRLAALLVLLAGCATPPAPDPRVVAEVRRIAGLVAAQPSNTAYIYVLATYYDRIGDTRNVVRLLERLDALGWDLGLRPDSFRQSAASHAFQRIAAKLEARETAVHRGVTAFTLPKDVRSEGIAWDPVDDAFYIHGGESRLLRVSRSGAITELATEPAKMRLGMKVDAERRLLWIASPDFVTVHSLPDGRSCAASRTGRSRRCSTTSRSSATARRS